MSLSPRASSQVSNSPRQAKAGALESCGMPAGLSPVAALHAADSRMQCWHRLVPRRAA